MSSSGEVVGGRQARVGPMPTGGRWGWYRDHEGREHRRVSTLIKQVETDTYNLDLWKVRQAVEGLAIRDDLVLAVKAMGRPDPVTGWSREDKRKLNGIAKDAQTAAKQRDGARTGTAVHDLTERLDRGESIDDVARGLPATAAQSLRAYAFLRQANAWRSVEIERTVVLDELEVAGTFDRVDLIPGLAAMLGPGVCQYGNDPGHVHDYQVRGDAYSELPVIGDVKTEAEPWRNGLHIGPQLAIYSRARKMWRATGGVIEVRYTASGDPETVPAGEYVPAPCVRQDVAVVVHVHDGQATPYLINLAEGWEAAQAAYAQINRVARAKRALGAAGAWFVPLPVEQPKVTQMLTETAAAMDYANPARPAVGGEQVAVRRDDGLTDWKPATEHPLGAQVEVAGVTFTKIDDYAEIVRRGALDDVDRSAIEAAWNADGLPALAEVWRIYVEVCARIWAGPVRDAAEARQRQIECVQRATHGGSGKCACGWVSGVKP